MKKLTLIFAAVLTVAFVAPAFAADNLSLSGSFRVRGWSVQDANYGFDPVNQVFVDDQDQSFIDQRMRVQAKIAASDNAVAVIRADMGDTQWGTGFQGVIQRPGRNNNAQQIDFDRLYGQFTQDMWALTIGQQFLGLGILEVLDANMVAAKLDLKFGTVNPTLIYGKISENGSLNDAGVNDVNDDNNLYVANVNIAAGAFDINAFGAMADDKGNDTDMRVLGLHTKGKLGSVNLVAEIANFGGDAGRVNNQDIDWTGTQAYVKGDADVSDGFNVGAEILWAAGSDEADEAQLTNLADFGDFTIADTNAPCATDVTIMANTGFGTRGPFDFSGQGAGVLGASVFGSFKVSSELSFGAKLAHLTTEEDDALDMELTSFSVWGGYNLGSNTSLVMLYNIATPDVADVDGEEDMKTLYARFLITF